MTDRSEFLKAAARVDASTLARMLAMTPELVHTRGEHGMTALHWAAEKDAAEVAEVLLDAGADPDRETDWGATPLDWAATMGSLAVAEVLLPKCHHQLDFITAASLGMIDEVRRFVETGNLQPRRAAPSQPDEHWVEGCAHLRGDVLSDGLYSACRNGQIEVAEFLVDAGADPNATGVFGATGLHWAAINGHAETVEFLLSRGADIDRKDVRFAATPRGWATEGGHHELAERLAAME